MTLQEIYKKVVEERTPIKTFKVQGKTGNWNVDLWKDGKMTCDCPCAVFRKKECKHKKEIRDYLIASFGGILEAIDFYQNKKYAKRNFY